MHWLVPLFFFLACTPSPRANSPLLATVNGEKIFLESFEQYLELEQWKFGEAVAQKPQEALQTRAKVLDDFLRHRLLLTEAKKRGIRLSPQELKGQMEQLQGHYPRREDFEKLLAARGWTAKDFEQRQTEELIVQKLAQTITEEGVKITEEEMRHYYEANPVEFEHPEQVLARQIVTDSREKGTAIRQMLLQGASFEEAALKYSLSPDRKQGGSLGWFERGVMPKEFDDICFFLEVGRMSPVIRTSYGYHLFQVLDKRPAGRFPFEEVKEKIAEKLKAEKGRRAFQDWFEQFRKGAKIKIYANAFEKMP